jgi:hypothetical protein
MVTCTPFKPSLVGCLFKSLEISGKTGSRALVRTVYETLTMAGVNLLRAYIVLTIRRTWYTSVVANDNKCC